MSKLQCKLILDSAAEHCQQIYTGLAELEHEGLLELDVEVSDNYNSATYGRPLVLCYINKKIKLMSHLQKYLAFKKI